MDYADSTTICDDDWLFLIDHYEEAMDTTVMTAKEYGIPVHLYLQTFGAAGGSRMLESDTPALPPFPLAHTYTGRGSHVRGSCASPPGEGDSPLLAGEATSSRTTRGSSRAPCSTSTRYPSMRPMKTGCTRAGYPGVTRGWSMPTQGTCLPSVKASTPSTSFRKRPFLFRVTRRHRRLGTPGSSSPTAGSTVRSVTYSARLR